SDSPAQVLFFDRKSPIGTPTPDPRPYITITPTANDIAAVQYQWRQGQEPACCPTGIATVRFKIEDGKLKALDPIPNG
ncbi:MAG: LppP/LprE family lipoprotein, partial [Mycobacterium sp.]|nr:LppP/LprE family lipoprotein [Mycobacterium sp.]